MVHPFNIDEIFPDSADGSTQLPRRQSGSSPQGLAVTLLADYTIQGRTWLPSAALVALLAESGVNTAGARTAISRLARRGVLETSRQGRHSFYRLTQDAAENLARGARRIAAFVGQAESWDGWWTLVAFSLPQEASAQRRTLRGQLRWLGYAPLYDGLWVSPHNLGHTPRAKLSAIALGATSVFRARHVEIEAVTNRIPIDAWDTAALSHQYDSFIRRWNALLPAVQSGDVTGAAAVRARTEVMDAYRRFPILDPLLPIELMPAGWPRRDARAVFVGVYDGLAEPAQEHVRAVANRYTTAPQPDIRAHRVDQLGDLRADGNPHLAVAIGKTDRNG